MGQSEIRSDADCVLKVRTCCRQPCLVPALTGDRVDGLVIVRPRGQIFRALAPNQSDLSPREFRLQLRQDAARDSGLHILRILAGTVELPVPQNMAACCVGELGRYTHCRILRAQTPLNQVTHSKLPGNLGQAGSAFAKHERRGARDQQKAGHPRQQRRDISDQAVCQERISGVGGEHTKGQHRNGGLVRLRRGIPKRGILFPWRRLRRGQPTKRQGFRQHFGSEAKPSAGHSGDQTGAQNLAQGGNLDGKIVLFHDQSRPHSLKQFLLGDQTVPVLDQPDEHIKGTRAQPGRHSVGQQLAFGGLDLESVETVDTRHSALGRFSDFFRPFQDWQGGIEDSSPIPSTYRS